MIKDSITAWPGFCSPPRGSFMPMALGGQCRVGRTLPNLATPCPPVAVAHLSSALAVRQLRLRGLFWEMQRTKRTQIIFYRCCCLQQKSWSELQRFAPPLILALLTREERKTPTPAPNPADAGAEVDPRGCPTITFLPTNHPAAKNSSTTLILGLFPGYGEEGGEDAGLAEVPSPLKFSCALYSNGSLMSLSLFPATLSHH